VVSERHAQQVKPDRVVYAITDTGRAELAEWLGAPSPRGSGFRDDFFLKVTAAARSGSADTVRAVLNNQRGLLLRELRNLETLRRERDDPVVALLLSAAARHVEADLLFIEDADGALLQDGGATLARLRVTAEAAKPDAAVRDAS
jgi:DNA-binding PadR family transcriptional regulator